MMKNMEWGAVAYLSSSKYGLYNLNEECSNSNQGTIDGCEIYLNNINVGYGNDSNHNIDHQWGPTVTGCSAINTNDDVISIHNKINPTCINNYDWSNNGILASATGNMYGIYDMTGGTWEYVMGNQSNNTAEYVWNNYSASFNNSNKPSVSF